MSGSKNYLTVLELQQICEKLGLPADGLKHELIERISNFVAVESPRHDNSAGSQSDISRIVFSRLKLAPLGHSEQTSRESSLNWGRSIRFDTIFQKFGSVLQMVALAIGFFGGCVVLSHLFVDVEKISIPVRHSWFW